MRLIFDADLGFLFEIFVHHKTKDIEPNRLGKGTKNM